MIDYDSMSYDELAEHGKAWRTAYRKLGNTEYKDKEFDRFSDMLARDFNILVNKGVTVERLLEVYLSCNAFGYTICPTKAQLLAVLKQVKVPNEKKV